MLDLDKLNRRVRLDIAFTINVQRNNEIEFETLRRDVFSRPAERRKTGIVATHIITHSYGWLHLGYDISHFMKELPIHTPPTSADIHNVRGTTPKERPEIITMYEAIWDRVDQSFCQYMRVVQYTDSEHDVFCVRI